MVKLELKQLLLLKGNNDYTTGDFISLTSLSDSLDQQTAARVPTTQKLRISEITHQLDKKGWITTLQLQEDESAIA